MSDDDARRRLITPAALWRVLRWEANTWVLLGEGNCLPNSSGGTCHGELLLVALEL